MKNSMSHILFIFFTCFNDKNSKTLLLKQNDNIITYLKILMDSQFVFKTYNIEIS